VTHLDRLVGTWVTEASHPALPGVVVHGEAVLEWLEGEQFLVVRARTDHPEFPDSISVIGVMDTDRVGEEANDDSPLSMHYFDSRGVFRVYQVHVDDGAWRLWRDAAGFSQRFTGVFSDGGDTIVGRWQLCGDELRWDDDLEITYRRSRERDQARRDS
jgi:hypothetical protein